MNLTTRRVFSASLPVAILAGATLAASATPVVRGAVKPAVTVRSITPDTVAVSAYGGGATLPIPAYVGVDLSSGSTAQGATGSVFGYLFPGLTYCSTGSGKGKGVFTGALGSVTNPCANAGTGTPPYGFSAPASTKIPAFTGSDSPLSQSDYNSYVTNVSSFTTEATEIPSITGSVAMFYNEPSCGKLTLTEAQIASIFSGKTTNWSAFPGCAADPIVVAYRSDGSGTSFIFSNNLATNAPTSGFSGNQQFFPATGVTGSAYPTAPAGSIGAKGNNGVYLAVQGATAGTITHAIGYVEAGFVVTHPPLNGQSALVVNPHTNTAQDSVKNLPEAANTLTYATGSTVKLDSIVNAGLPGKPATVSVLSPAAKVAGCVVLINPAAYASPSKGYPIFGATYLLAAYKGNGALTTNERAVITGLNTPTNFAVGKITTVDPAAKALGTGTRGYSAFGTSFNSNLKTIATKCINN